MPMAASPCNRLLRSLPLAALPLLAGCATLFTGTSDVLTFDANVPGVRLSIDGEYKGQLPLTLEVSRNFVGGRQFIARFERAGYQTQEFRMYRQFNAVAILDVTSIPTSGGIDVLTGALMVFSPRDYHVQMLRGGASVTDAEFQRSVRVRHYALASFARLQADLSRGGGPHLDALAAALAGDDAEVAREIRAEALRCAPILLGATSPRDLVGRLDGMLGASDGLRGLRI